MAEERLGLQLEAGQISQGSPRFDIGDDRARSAMAQVRQTMPLGQVCEHGGEPV
jgi:hypothetical protein